MRKALSWTIALLSLMILCAPAIAAPIDAALLVPRVVVAPGEDASANPVGEKKARAKRKKSKTERPGKKKLRGEYSIMASVLKMDEAQTAKLAETVRKYQEAMKAWGSSPNGQKYKELSAAAKQARKDKDKEKMKSISEEMKSLRKEREELATAQKAEVLAILTDQQKAEWAGFSLYRSTVGRYKRLQLTEDQNKQIREICQATAKTLPDRSDRKAYYAARKELSQNIEEKVLTDAQREELKKNAPAKKAREPRAKKASGKRARGNQPVIVE